MKDWKPNYELPQSAGNEFLLRNWQNAKRISVTAK